MTDPVDLREFTSAFVVEAEEIVTTANASLLEIEVAGRAGRPHPRAVRDLFRALHTLKGLACMIGLEPIVGIAHALETMVRSADRAGGPLHHAAIEIALQGVAAIAERVRAVAEHREIAEPPEVLIEAIEATQAIGAAPASGLARIPPEWQVRLSPSERQQLALALHTDTPVWTLSFVPSPANASRGITIATVGAGLTSIGEIVKVVPRAIAATADLGAPGEPLDARRGTGVAFDILIISDATPAVIAQLASTEPERVIRVQPAPGPDEPGPIDVTGSVHPDEPVSPVGRPVVRVELSRLDDLQDQLSLLIVSRFRLDREIASLAERGHDVRRLRESAQLQAGLLRDLRRAILRARMVRVDEMLQPLTLLVRGLARSGQRAVQLELDARDAELDKAVADRLLPALIHLVRNAVDHGIEPPEHRVALGKPRAGTVRVSCTERAGNQLQLVVSDDGRGIDRAAVAQRANRPIDDDASLLEVLTSPGFSTRDAVTTTSGRGLGLDIAHRIAVGDLGGVLSMTTQPGSGTAFTLRVPVTIAVMDVFTFQCGSQTFVIPAALVDEIIDVEPDMLVAPPSPRTGSAIPSLSLIEQRGHAIPIVSLGAILAVDSGARARKAMVTRRNGDPLAFTVDRVVGRQEVVVRTVDDPLVNVPGIAGATDLGDGRPTLVLDLNELGIIARARGMS